MAKEIKKRSGNQGQYQTHSELDSFGRNFDTTIDGSPVVQGMQINNVDYSLATSVDLNEIGRGSTDEASLINTIALGDKIKVTALDSPARNVIFNATGAPTTGSIPVTHVDSGGGGNFLDGEGVNITIYKGGGNGSAFIDDVFRIQDDGDNTKEIAFQASAITTATTRTVTMPDADVDLSNLDQDVTIGSSPILDGANISGIPLAGVADGIEISVRNASGSTLVKAQAVYISGFHVGSNEPQVSQADADSGGAFPVVGLIKADILNNANGDIIFSGRLEGFDTSVWTTGDALFLSIDPSTTFGLTNTKPIGATTVVQKVAEVLRSHATLGSIEVFGAGRTNDLPNIAEDNIWVGDSDGVPQAVLLPKTIFSDYIIGSTSGPSTTVTTSGTAVIIAEMTKTFTPASATNKIEVNFGCSFSNSGDQTAIVGIFIDGVLEVETETREYSNAGVFTGSVSIFWQGTHATSSMVITVRMWTSGGTLTAIGVLRNMLVKEIRE